MRGGVAFVGGNDGARFAVLVVAIARGYVNRGVPLLDLIQEGTLGLHAAVDGFDHQQGARVSTYATWLIRSAIQRAIVRQARTIRVPSDVLAKLGWIWRAETSIMLSKQRTPTWADLADIAAAAGMTVEEVMWVRGHTMPETSLDAPMGPGVAPSSARNPTPSVWSSGARAELVFMTRRPA